MKSSTLFFLGCIPVRLLLAYIAYMVLNHTNYTNKNIRNIRNILIVITFLIGMGFWSIYLMGWRKKGFEVDTNNGKIWWNKLRPIHGTIYILFSILAFMGYKNSYMLLIVDVFIGILAELSHIYGYI